MLKEELLPGAVFNRIYTVTNDWTAISLGTGNVPCLSSAALVIAVENLAYQNIQKTLEDGFTSVGIKIEVTHLFPSAIESEFQVELHLIRLENNRTDFNITVTSGERILATGFHRRAIVNHESFLGKISPR
ncbi:MAG: hypothetical protein JXR95_06950 [Deltaproteobacteria bacterium]|nr:hypothetical protein [Deltaproteobacteria bacterium]